MSVQPEDATVDTGERTSEAAPWNSVHHEPTSCVRPVLSEDLSKK